MAESTVAMATADVMMYDDATKQWLSPDGSNEPARSQVRILHNVHANTFRIVGTRLQDGQWILNCNVYERLRYKSATPTFHQWRDEKRKVYGLSFVQEDDARLFVKVMTQALSILTSSSDYQNGSDLGILNGIYQEPHQLHHNAYSAPTFRAGDDESLYSAAGGGGSSPAQNMNNFRKSSQSVQSSASGGGSGGIGVGIGTAMLSNAQQRRASQGSSSSSNGSSLPPATAIYATASSSTISNSNTCSNNSPVRPAPTVPPLTNNHHNASSPSPAASAANVATVCSNAPPAPPPPPPPSALSLSKGTGSSIAEQLKKVQLRKISTQPSSISAASGSSNLLSELEATLSKRKNQCDNSDSRSVGSDTAAPSTNTVTNGTLRRPWEKQINGTAANITDSPKPHRKLPSSNSLNQDESRSAGGSSSNVHGSAAVSTANSAVIMEMLEKWKDELLGEIRQEINKAKSEIIEALRLQRR